MKFSIKILAIFFASIVSSILIFLLVIWYLVNNGWWAGVNMKMMNEAADGAANELSTLGMFDTDAALPILNKWKSRYPGVELELIQAQTNEAVTTAAERQVATVEELMENLSMHGRYAQERRLAARKIIQGNDEAYLTVVVPMKNYAALTYTINPYKGLGIFGKMCLIGLGITIVVSFTFALIFNRQLTNRFARLYKEISAFGLENMEIEINDSSRDEIGQLAGLVTKMSERLKRQIEEEKAAQEERKRLVSNISHDLRTPLTSIVGYSESLLDGIVENENERKHFVSVIHRKALYMEKLLGELLELSKLESGSYELKKQPADLSELVREILIEYLQAIQNKNMELIADIPDEALMTVLDRNGISRVIRNLLDNALRYCGEFGIIGVAVRGSGGSILISVSDNGPGIGADNLEAVFQRFYRGDKARTMNDAGMGLGLAIADEIVKLHGGHIELKSCIGKGTTFIVHLPDYPVD